MKIKRLPSGLVISVLFASASSLVPAATYTSTATGDWSDPSKWDVGVGFPNTYTADSAIISATQVISYDGAIPTLGGNLVVANGNAITINGGTLQQTWVPGAPPPFGTTIAIGVSSAGTGGGTLNINAGGSFISGTANTVVVGVTVAALGGGAANGQVNINEGTMTLSGSASGASGGLGLAVGVNAGATGTMNVGDAAGAADSSLLDLATNNVTLTVGGTNGEGAGTGTVTIKSDGRVNTGTARAYVGDAGTGTLAVDGGTLAIGTGSLTVGRNGGNGTLAVSAGLATIDGPAGDLAFIVGDGVGSVGSVNVSGGTLNSVNNMVIGANGGVGTVTQTGGAVSYGGWMAIGHGAGVGGSSYNISGGTLTGAAPLEIGADREGSMSISGTANVTVDKIAVGIRNNSNGTLNISGGTTTTKFLSVAGDQAGATHTGLVNITGGTNTIAAGGGQSYVGRQAGSTGTLNLNGGALTNASGQDFQIGFEGGTGNVNVTNGGTLNHNWWLNLARGAGSTGQVTVSGAGSAVSITGADARTNVGEDGSGTLTISNGGSFSTQSEVAVGRNAGSVGTLNISDAGSSLNLTGADRHLYVGGREGTGSGTMTLSGGAVNMNGNRIQVADSGNSTGTVNITGGQITNSQWFHVGAGAGANGTVNINYTNPADTLTTGAFYVGNGGATGTLNVLSGVVTASNVAEIGRGGGTGNYNQTGGSLAVGGLFALGIGGTGLGNISGGTTSSGGDFRVGDGGGSATLNISDTASITANGEFQVGNALGTGVVNMTGGNILANSWVAIGRDGGTGTFNLDGGTFTKGAGNGTFDIGTFGNGATPARGVLNQTGGAIVNTVSTTHIARDATGSGEWNMSGGTANLAALIVANTGNGTLNLSGTGAITIGGEFNVGRSGTSVVGTVTQTGGQIISNQNNNDGNWIGRDGAQGTWNLSGGSATLAGGLTIGAGAGGSNGTVNITNATLNANGWLAMGRDTGGSATTSTLNIGSGGIYSHPVGLGGDALIGWQNGSTATVNVTDGGQMNYAWWFRVGVDPGSTGNINIDGVGSKLLQDSAGGGRIIIGEQGTGTLNVTNGGVYQVINGDQFQVGGNTDANTSAGRGTLNISGAGSLVTTNNYFRAGVGSDANGRAEGIVNISDGGTLSTGQWGGVGHDGGKGTLNMDGGTLQIGTDWHVGIDTNGRAQSSLGEMNINGASTVTTGGNFFVGRNGGTGTVTKNDGTVSIGTDLDVGRDGVGVYTNAGGVTNVGRHALIGHGANGNGTLNVSGGALNITNNLDVANGGGDATVNITGGSSVTMNEIYVGTNAGSIGTINISEGTLNLAGWAEIGRYSGSATINIDGPNSSFDGSSSDMQIGHQGGTGTINVVNGGQFSHNWWVNLGRDGGTGNMTVDGAGSKVTLTRRNDGNNDARFNIGGDPNGSTNNTGVLTISNGGLVERTSDGGEVNVGRGAGSTGTMNISSDGRFTNVGANFLVGVNSGTGTVNISSGGQFTSGFGEVGIGLNGTGTVNITGAGSKVLVSTRGDDNFHRVGQSAGGNGTLNITDGGEWHNNGWFTLGEAGSVGAVTVDGAGSKLTTTNGLIIGWSGPSTGTLTVSNDAVVNSTGREVSIGRDLNGVLATSPTGIVNLVAGGTLNGVNLRVGHGATGTVNIDGGKLNSTGGWAIVADGASSSGTINMSSGSINTTDSMFVGFQGAANGTINQQGGSTNIGNEFMLGRSGATGTLNLSGGTFNVNGWTVVGGGRDGGGGTGTINVSDGAKYTHLQGGGELLNGWQSGSTGTISITSGGRMDYNATVRIGIDSGSNGTVTINGAGSAFEQRSGARFIVGEGGTGTLNVSDGGRLVAGSGGIVIGGHPDEVDAGTGTVTLNVGHIETAGEINAGFDVGSTGNIIVDAGTMTNNSWFIVGRAGQGVYTQTGGRVWNSAQELRVGNDASGNGTMNISGGSFNSFSHGMVGESGSGTLNLTGGIVGIGCCTGGNLYIGHLNGSSGTVNVAGGLLDVGGAVEFNTNGGAIAATLNLNAGILAADFINNPTANGVALLNATGGTLKATQNEANFIRGMASSQLVLDGAGLTIDTNNFTVNVNSVFSGAGDLTKSGFGTLNLTATQASTGNTGVTSGVLNLDFTTAAAPNDLVANSGLVLGGGTLRVNTSATLANTQNFTGTTIASGGSRVEIQENGGAGTINLGALTRNAGGTVDIGVTGTVNTSDANTNGILGKGVTVNGNEWAKNDGTGKIVAATAGDYSATFGAANNLDVAAPITGGGAVNSIKTSANITLDANTTVASGGILIPSTAGNVTIGSTAGETLTSGNGLDLVVIQNSAAGVATIDSPITGTIALTKSGIGTLVLGNAANNYSGGTYINSGALVIGSDSALGDVNGGITLAGASISTGGVLSVTDTMTLAATRAVTINSGGGGFNVAATKTLTINQGITGSGSLGKFGAGALVLGGTNTYTGDTAIFEGSLTMNGTIESAGAFIADGNVTLGTGGGITAAGAIQIARNAGPSVIVTGDAATISGGEFTIGGAGNASVTLTGASTLSASCDLFVARQGGSTSSLNVTNGSVIAQHAMVIGAAGGATGTATVTDGSLSVGTGLYVGNAGGSGTLNLPGTTVGSYGFLEVGNGGTGTLNISDSSTLKGSNAGNSGYINIGANNGTGTINQTGGEVSHNSWIAIGLGGGSNDPASAQYNLSGGTLVSAAGVEIGTDHGGSMNVSGTGALAVGSLSIGHRSNGNGVLNITGGTVTTNEITVAHNADNAGGTAVGVMNVAGGVTQINGALIVARNSGGGGSNGTVNFGGGEIKLTSINRGAGATAQLNFNGTVIKPNGSNVNFITGFDASSTDVQAGGAIFNTDGKLLGVTTSLDGVGALTKTGNGKLTLSGDSSYAGGVNLEAGTLSVRHNNALGTGAIVGNGGVLSFDNSEGAGLMEGRVSTTNGDDETSLIPFEATTLSTPKANTADRNIVGNAPMTWGYRGTLVIPAGGVAWTFGSAYDDNVLLKIDGNTILNQACCGPAIGQATLGEGEHSFELRIGDGGGGVGPTNGWPVGFGYDVQNRNTADGSFFAAMIDPGNGSLFKYSDGGSAEYTVGNAATLNVNTEIHVKQFGATMTGDIAGAGGINKTGNGRLTLAGTNSYAGVTNIAAGVLEIGNGGGTGSLGSGNVTNAGMLKFNRTGTLNVPGNISGTGTVEHNGAGTTILAGSNTYTGATTVNAGNLQIAGSLSGSVVTVKAAGTLSGAGTVGTVIVDGGTVAPGASAGILNSGDITFNGGTLSIEINGITAGSLYDQLNVAGAVTLQSNVALAMNFGFGATGGETFTIINNDGTDAIAGAGLLTFASVPLNDGDLFSDFGNGLSLQIDYNGGTDSNDVVLTVVPEPGSLVMVMGGLAILAGVRRRRK